jgi:hypothetical protein
LAFAASWAASKAIWRASCADFQACALSRHSARLCHSHAMAISAAVKPSQRP